MPEELTAEEAAARLNPDDTLGMPLGPGQPPAFLRTLGEREDWTDLRVYGALLAVGTELFSRPASTTCRASSVRSSGHCWAPVRISSSRPPTSAASVRCSRRSRRA